MDMRRLVLNAAILKLLEERDLAENLRICHESMVSLFSELDEVRAERRSGSDWTKEALGRVGMSRLGNFIVRMRNNPGRRVIRFSDDTRGIDFVFTHSPHYKLVKVVRLDKAKSFFRVFLPIKRKVIFDKEVDLAK